MSGWKGKLKASEEAYVSDILGQIPPAMGARAAFEQCLDNLAASGAEPKYRWYIINEDGDLEGTNDEELINRIMTQEEYAELLVVDVQEGTDALKNPIEKASQDDYPDTKEEDDDGDGDDD